MDKPGGLKHSIKVLQRRLMYLKDRLEQFERRGIPGASYQKAEISALTIVIAFIENHFPKDQQ